MYRTVKLPEERGIDRLELSDSRAPYDKSGEHREHLVDVETGEVIEIDYPDFEASKEKITRKMGCELVDYRLGLSGGKSIKSIWV
mgnify:CR=1 FL=1